MTKSFTKLYSRLVIGGMILLLGLGVFAGGLVLISGAAKAAGVGGYFDDWADEVIVLAEREDIILAAKESYLYENNDPYTDSCVLSDGTLIFPSKQEYSQYDRIGVMFTAVHNGSADGAIEPLTFSLNGNDADKFFFVRCCSDSHNHTPQAAFDEVTYNGYINNVNEIVGSSRCVREQALRREYILPQLR